jgi:3-hydroxyisobutyrate dehydrogenase-like beta-hydroxyacid dehydrogenase
VCADVTDAVAKADVVITMLAIVDGTRTVMPNACALAA